MKLLFQEKQICSPFSMFFFICALIPFSHSSCLLLPLFFSYSLLNYNGRRRVFPLQEKVEEHIEAAIFISKNPRVQRRWKNTLKLPFLSQKLHEYREGERTH
ncbi:hypothetical protein AAZX31_02G178400 [Glycine max]